jgi:hypothetical protein
MFGVAVGTVKADSHPPRLVMAKFAGNLGESKLAYYAISYSKEGQYLTSSTNNIRKLKDLPMTRDGASYQTYTSVVPFDDIDFFKLRGAESKFVGTNHKSTTVKEEILDQGKDRLFV